MGKLDTINKQCFGRRNLAGRKRLTATNAATQNNLFIDGIGKAEQFIELTKDKNPFSNPDKKTIPLQYQLQKLFANN